VVALLKEYGPHLPRPHADTLKELKARSASSAFRVAFIFEHRFVDWGRQKRQGRKAVLSGLDKTGGRNLPTVSREVNHDEKNASN